MGFNLGRYNPRPGGVNPCVAAVSRLDRRILHMKLKVCASRNLYVNCNALPPVGIAPLLLAM